MIQRRWLFMLFLVLTGCATPEAEILSKVESFPPTLSAEVLLDRPTRPPKTIAILGDTLGGTPEELNERLSRTARETGADAIIMSVHDKSTTDWLLDDPFYDPHGVHWPRYRPVRHTYRIVRAPAIKYLE